MTIVRVPGRRLLRAVCASLDGMAARMDREANWRQRIAQAVTQVPFAGTIPISGGDGSYDQPDQLQAKTGYVWGIRRLTVQGFTAGSVIAYRNSTAGEPVMPFPVPAVNTIGRGEELLMSGDRLVWAATGITGTVIVLGGSGLFRVLVPALLPKLTSWETTRSAPITQAQNDSQAVPRIFAAGHSYPSGYQTTEGADGSPPGSRPCMPRKSPTR